MNPEILSTTQEAKNTSPEISANFDALDEHQISLVIASRKALLESIKAQISLKAYYAAQEKLEAEEKRLKEILDFRLGRQSHLAKYTFVLNPNYFEQEFLN